MSTERLIAERLRVALANKEWRQSDLVRRSGVDKNTVSAIYNAKQQASARTLGKFEAALGMIPGTLAAIGEEPLVAEPSSALSDAELLAELGYRLTRLQRENDELRERLTQAPTAAVTPLRLQRPDVDKHPNADQHLDDVADGMLASAAQRKKHKRRDEDVEGV